MQFDIPQALKDLNKVVNHLAELVEWHHLAQQERQPGLPPSFQLRNDLINDIRATYGWFINMNLQLRQLMSLPDLAGSKTEKRQWGRRLHELERKVDELCVTDRFIKP